MKTVEPPTTITIIDYGLGNLHSVKTAFNQWANVHISTDCAQIKKAKKLILPGVGAFGTGMDALNKTGLADAIKEAVNDGAYLIGICLGLQLLFEVGHEKGTHKGLGLLKGEITPFPKGGKIPHMGWNTLNIISPHPALTDIPNKSYVYFAHSYIATKVSNDTIWANTNHGVTFPSIVGSDRILGLQFHPEKSQHIGLTILKNSIQWMAQL